MSFEKTRLGNGLEIIAEVNPHAVSTAVGFFVRAGSRDEAPDVAGVSHFLEHMAFKGTETRSADDINRLFDEIGAKYNAYTSEEHTVYHTAILPEYVAPAIDLLGDLLRPTLRHDDFETERNVILEEIGMYADSPLWSAFDRVVRHHFVDHPLGNSILGSTESIQKLSLDAMRRYHRERYTPSNIVLAASGKVDFEELVRLAKKKCGSWDDHPVQREVRPSINRGKDELVQRTEFIQEVLYLMAAAPSATDPLRFAADVLTVAIGDETGSRFFWSLVDPGRVESIEMSYHEYEGAGAFIIGASCDPGLASRNLSTIRQILGEVARSGITESELELAKSKISARLVLAAERPRHRLYPVGYNWLYRKEYRSIDQDLIDLEGVTLDDVGRLLKAFPLDEWISVALGPLTHVDGLRANRLDSISRAPSLNRK